MGTEAVIAGRIVVIGAGPCGLACARELERLGHDDWTVLEAASEAGGHAASVVDPQGFTWDIGGHVVFSHYGEFDALLDEVLGDDVYEHERSSFIRHAGRWVPYPFQNNLHHLDADAALDCVLDLARAPGADGAIDFETWTRLTFGDAIARAFMLPYNAKVWATPPRESRRRGSPSGSASSTHGARSRTWCAAWTTPAGGRTRPSAFHARGGTGEIYRRLADRLGERVRLEQRITAVHPARREVVTADGRAEPYDALVSTMPLDQLVRSSRAAPRTFGPPATRCATTAS